MTERILTVAEVCRITTFSRVHLHRLVRSGDFPAPVQVGARKVGWLRSTVQEWLASRDTVEWAPAPVER